jgi:hypothetical protein
VSSSSGIEWALDKVAELAGPRGDGDPALEVLLALVGALEPPPDAAALAPAARRIGRLRLAQALDRPGDLRLGAVRLLAALDASSPAPVAPHADSSHNEVSPAAPPERPGLARRRRGRADGRVVLTFPAHGRALRTERTPGPGAPAARRNGDRDPAPAQPAEPPGAISGPHTATLGSTLNLSGTAPPGDGPVTVEGSYDEGRTWQTLATVESEQGRYATGIALSRRGQLHLRIVFADASTAVGSILVR